MLVLSRGYGQEIVIGEGAEAVTVRFLRSRGGQLRVGIEAPASVPIRRGELPPRKAEEEKDESKR